MRFSLTLSALAALAATAFAQDATEGFDPISSPKEQEKVPAGEPFEIVWAAQEPWKEGTISISLIGGETQGTQEPLADLASGITNTDEKYTWEVDASLGDAKVYGLKITLDSDPQIFQYSFPFQIVKSDKGDKGDVTTTIKKDYGVKTITLSSCDCEETSTVSPPPVETTPTPVETTPVPTPTMIKPPTTIKTKPAPAPTDDVEEVPEPTEPPATIPEEGAGVRFGASSVALVGAFIVAALSL